MKTIYESRSYFIDVERPLDKVGSSVEKNYTDIYLMTLSKILLLGLVTLEPHCGCLSLEPFTTNRVPDVKTKYLKSISWILFLGGQ